MTKNKKKPDNNASEKMTAKRRRASASVHIDGKDKFPVDNAHSARSAVHLLNSAKPPLSSSQRATVMKNVHKYLPEAKAPGKKSTK